MKKILILQQIMRGFTFTLSDADNSLNNAYELIQQKDKEIKALKAELAKWNMETVKEYIASLEKENKALIADLASMKKAFNLANNWRNDHLDDSKLLKNYEKMNGAKNAFVSGIVMGWAHQMERGSMTDKIRIIGDMKEFSDKLAKSAGVIISDDPDK